MTDGLRAAAERARGAADPGPEAVPVAGAALEAALAGLSDWRARLGALHAPQDLPAGTPAEDG